MQEELAERECWELAKRSERGWNVGVAWGFNKEDKKREKLDWVNKKQNRVL